MRENPSSDLIRQRTEEGIQNHPPEPGGASVTIKVGSATYPEEALSKEELFRLTKERLGG